MYTYKYWQKITYLKDQGRTVWNLYNKMRAVLYFSIVSHKHQNLEIPVEIFSHESIQSMPHLPHYDAKPQNQPIEEEVLQTNKNIKKITWATGSFQE